MTLASRHLYCGPPPSSSSMLPLFPKKSNREAEADEGGEKTRSANCAAVGSRRVVKYGICEVRPSLPCEPLRGVRLGVKVVSILILGVNDDLEGVAFELR